MLANKPERVCEVANRGGQQGPCYSPLDSVPPGSDGRLLRPRIASMVCRGPGCCDGGGLTGSPLNNILAVTRSVAPCSLLSASIACRRLPCHCHKTTPLLTLFSQKRFRAYSSNSLFASNGIPITPPLLYIKGPGWGGASKKGARRHRANNQSRSVY